MRWAILWVALITIVLLPFVLFGEQFEEFGKQITQSGTSRWLVAAAVFSLLALDVFLPVPSSIVSTGAGVLLGFAAGTTVVWSGMMAGCLLGYAVGSRGSAAARRFVGEDGIARAADLVKRYGDLTIVLCRPVPVLAEASVVFAGLVRAHYGRFLRLTATSNLGIAAAYGAVGAYSRRLDTYSFLIAFLGALLLPGIFILISRTTFGRDRSR
jgi:membrane protein DedA with SNARE-associated domain